MPNHILLLCTVGGSPEPLVATLKHWQPARVWFLPTPETRDQVAARIIPLAAAEGFTLDAGRYDCLPLPDSQDLARCVDKIRELTPEVERWLNRGDDFQVVVDFTGGTKCMTAALALQAHRWRCRFSYVGGSERTKEGVGIVVSGKEQVLHTQNPWDALGYQAVEEATVLFDQGALGSVSQLLERALRYLVDPARKRELQALKILADGYDAWDRFDHRDALSKLHDVRKYENDLSAVLGRDRWEWLRPLLTQHRTYLAQLLDDAGPTPTRVQDLLANAQRRGLQKRHDDAVARLYRALEAIAQVRLRITYGITETGQVPLEQLPASLAKQWSNRLHKGTVFLGLQDDYTLLLELGDELGHEFLALGLNDRQKSPLVSRNQSILAHGFDRVSDKVFATLWEAALQLARLTEADLPVFPRLGGAGPA